jgi:hypothetical protein
MTTDVFRPLSGAELALATGGQMAPSTMMNMGVNAMSLLDHPQKTLDTVKGFLGIPDSGRPGDVYTPARANADGSITQGRFDAPTTPGVPEVPISQ